MVIWESRLFLSLVLISSGFLVSSALVGEEAKITTPSGVSELPMLH